MNYQLTTRERELLTPRLPGIGMSQTEVKTYSLLRALDALANPNTAKRDGIEFEASAAVAKALGREHHHSHNFFVPPEILQRDLNVASAGAGGYLVETSNVSFIDVLRNRSVIFRMGATRLPGLTGDAAIPKQTGAASVTWLSTETSEAAESDQTFGQVGISPKTASTYTEISRKLTMQSSPAAEGIVTRDLAAAVALGVDAAGINGSGAAGEPLGILNTTGIHTATGASIAYDGILETQSDTLGSNALIDLSATGYVATTAVASLLMGRVKFTNTDAVIWEGGMADGTMVGFRAMSSQQMPTATMLFGDWSQLLVGEWGVLEIAVNPFANFKAGIIGVRAMYSVDIAVRHAESFCAVTSIS